MDPRCQVTEPSRAMRLLPACPEHSSCLGESKYSCCLVALLNSLDGLPSDSVVCLEKLECATRSAHHSQCTRELLKLPLLPSCCGGADPTSIRGSSWPFSSGMCCRQRGQKGKEPGSRRKWIMEWRNLQLWKEANPKGRTVTFSVNRGHKRKTSNPTFQLYSPSSPRPAFLFVVTHTRHWGRPEINGSRCCGEALSSECPVF